MSSGYLSLAVPVEHEIEKVKGSRFLAWIEPAHDAAAADAVVVACRLKHADASHHVWAYRLPPDGGVWRASDDGEPKGTGGPPLLRRLEGAGLVGAVLVVSRWFGGTKLGVGGLIRAYGAAAAAVLERVEPRRVVPRCRVRVRFPYTMEGAVKGAMAREGWAPLDATYDQAIELVFEIDVEESARLEACLREATSGQAVVAVSASQ